jgi:hypothetical protein
MENEMSLTGRQISPRSQGVRFCLAFGVILDFIPVQCPAANVRCKRCHGLWHEKAWERDGFKVL